MTLGNKIRSLRHRKAWSQETLASEAKLKTLTLRNIEKGKTQPVFQTIQKIARALEVTPEELNAAASPSSEPLSIGDVGKLMPAKEHFQLGDADDLTLATHWSDVLRIFARVQNVIGPRELHQVVRNELTMISRRRQRMDNISPLALVVVEAQWAEFASWIAVNLGRHDESQRWLVRSLILARTAGHQPLIAYSLMRQAQQAADYGDAATTTMLAQEAASLPAVSSRDVALCKVREAQGLALAGDDKGCRAAIDSAIRLVNQADATCVDDDPRTIGRHCTPAYVHAHSGYCRLLLNETPEAIRTLHESLADLSISYRNDEALARSWLALAYSRTGQLDAAAAQGMRALAIASDFGSARILRCLRGVDARLTNCKRLPVNIAKFRAAYAASLGRQ